MVARCANPGCAAPFLYLHQGKLFRMESDVSFVSRNPGSPDPEGKKPARRVEYFWLCRDCAAEMTLVFKKGVGVTTKPLAPAQPAAS
jgi:hypothetical protein